MQARDVPLFWLALTVALAVPVPTTVTSPVSLTVMTAESVVPHPVAIEPFASAVGEHVSGEVPLAYVH